MTLKEKLEEITSGRVTIKFDENNKQRTLFIDGELYSEDCPDNWFDVRIPAYCPCDVSIDLLCWGREYNGEKYIGDKDLLKDKDTDNKKTLVNYHVDNDNKHNIEVIDFIQDWNLNFCLGNVVKHICYSQQTVYELQQLKVAMKYLKAGIDRMEKLKDKQSN